METDAADRRRRRARGGSRRLCAPPIRRERRSRRVGRRARRRRRTRHPERPSAPSAARPPEMNACASRRFNLWPEARRARARVRTEIVEVAAGKGRVVRGSLLAAQHRLHRALVSPAERAKTAPAIPNPAPKTAHPRAEGVPLRGGKAISGKGGAHLNAREPHEVGRRFTVHRPSIDEIRQKTRKRPRTPKSGRTNFLMSFIRARAKKISGFFFRTRAAGRERPGRVSH